ncbi:hypothetical protein Tco_0019236 [Tanacetum coccineum]
MFQDIILWRCNNYTVLQSIPCSPECKIVGQILLDHPLNYASTGTADVPAVYLQQFWQTVHKVPNTKDTVRFKLDTQEITYTMDMFRSILHLPVETPDNPFVAPVNIETIQAFMNRVGYQGVVDKNVFEKKEAIQYHRFIKLIIADLMKKFLEIPLRIDEGYHSIKDDTPLVSVYTTWNVLVRGMLIPDAFLTKEICATDDFNEYETVFMNIDVPMNQPQPVVSTQGMHRSTPRAHRTPTLTASTYGKKRKQTAGESSSLRKSHKITIRKKKQSTTPIPPPAQENIAKVQEKLDEEEIEKMVEGDKDEELYASEFADSMLNDDFDDSGTRLEPGSHKENPEHVDDDDDDDEKVDETKDAEMGSLETRTEEMQTPIPTPPRSPRIILSSDKNTTQELTDAVPLPTVTTSKDPKSKRSISSKYSHLPGALRRMCRRQGYMIQNMERTCVTRKYFWKTHKKVDQVLHEMKRSLQDQANDQALWEVEEIVIDEDEVIPEDETPELTKLQNVDKHVPTIFDYARMKATLNGKYFIVKFFDATLEKVLKEVKLKIFQSEPWKKRPLLGELDRDIMRAFERETTKRLSHREHMRRWESFVNGRPILPTMKFL